MNIMTYDKLQFKRLCDYQRIWGQPLDSNINSLRLRENFTHFSRFTLQNDKSDSYGYLSEREVLRVEGLGEEHDHEAEHDQVVEEPGHQQATAPSAQSVGGKAEKLRESYFFPLPTWIPKF